MLLSRSKGDNDHCMRDEHSHFYMTFTILMCSFTCPCMTLLERLPMFRALHEKGVVLLSLDHTVQLHFRVPSWFKPTTLELQRSKGACLSHMLPQSILLRNGNVP